MTHDLSAPGDQRIKMHGKINVEEDMKGRFNGVSNTFGSVIICNLTEPHCRTINGVKAVGNIQLLFFRWPEPIPFAR
jgi:hypothetical protein